MSVLHGGLSRLGELAVRARTDQASLQAQTEQIGDLAEDATAQAAAGRLLASERLAVLRNGTDDFLNGLLSKAWSTSVEGIRTAIAERLSNWRKDKEYRQYLSEWLTATNSQIDDWQQDTRTRLGARIGSLRFRSAMPGADISDTGPQAKRVADALQRADKTHDIGYVAAGAKV